MGPLKNKSGITSNNKRFTFIADNLLNRLVCLRWTSKTQRKGNFSHEARAVPLKTHPKLNPVLLRLSAMISRYFTDRGV
jgi:hypothetical protein